MSILDLDVHERIFRTYAWDGHTWTYKGDRWTVDEKRFASFMWILAKIRIEVHEKWT